MSINPNVQADFFGKDNLTSFLGVVEDVNDPKQSGRVKVRCVGWHPNSKEGTGEGEDGLSTEDLPWARVAMPTTHAQQSRIGGKHGLLPGTWVFGIFLDGHEANDPMILNTFNFTSKATEEDLRALPEGQDGTFGPADKAFDKVEVSPKTQPNIATRSAKEQGQRGYSSPVDPSGDNVHTDQTDQECGEHEGAASTRRMKEEFREQTAEAQEYKVTQGDGRASTTAHAAEDVQVLLEEKMPSQLARFTFGDVVWDRFTGNYMNMNGIILALAFEIANLMKAPAQAGKAMTEKTANRTTKASAILAIPDRDGVMKRASDFATSTAHDAFHAAFQQGTINTLFQTISGSLTMINNTGASGAGAGTNAGNDLGANPNTPVTNWGDPAISDLLMFATQIEMQNSLLAATVESALALGPLDIPEEIIDTLFEFFLEEIRIVAGQNNVPREQIDEEFILRVLEIGIRTPPVDTDEDGDTGEGQGFAAGGAVGGLIFSLIDEYTQHTEVFNKSGNLSQDILNAASKFTATRKYSTGGGNFGATAGKAIGAAGAAAAQAAANAGGDAGAAVNPLKRTVDLSAGTTGYGSDGLDRRSETGFGGLSLTVADAIANGTFDASSAFAPTYPDPGPEKTTFNADGSVTFEEPPYSAKGAVLVDAEGNEYLYGGINDPRTVIKPSGINGRAGALSIPAGNAAAGYNFRNGIPNVVVINEPGKRYYYTNRSEPEKAFPTVFIPGYEGRPVPVVDPATGGMVAILTVTTAWDSTIPYPTVGIIPDKSPLGIRSDDPLYNITLSTIFIRNSGFGYVNPTIKIIDEATGLENGKAVATVKDGRIVNIEITDVGNKFTMLPSIVIDDPSFEGYGCILKPVMDVTPTDRLDVIVPPEEFVFCPTKNQLNY